MPTTLDTSQIKPNIKFLYARITKPNREFVKAEAKRLNVTVSKYMQHILNHFEKMSEHDRPS